MISKLRGGSGWFALQKDVLDAFLHHLSALVENLQLALHHAAIGTRGFSLFQYFDPDMDRIAGFDRLVNLRSSNPSRAIIVSS